MPVKYPKACRECQSDLSQLALQSGICTPCWWRTRAWETASGSRWKQRGGMSKVSFNP
jgi:hypothetical protein